MTRSEKAMEAMRLAGEREPLAVPAPAPAAPPPAPDRPAREVRERFGSRMKRGLQQMLKQEALALSGVRGERVTLEDVLEALTEEYRDDPALQERVRRRLEER